MCQGTGKEMMQMLLKDLEIPPTPKKKVARSQVDSALFGTYINTCYIPVNSYVHYLSKGSTDFDGDSSQNV